MKRLILVILAGLLLAPPPTARAQEEREQILVVAQLLSVSMRRDDYSVPLRANRDGEIIVSNSCGELEATFRVVRSERRVRRRIVVTQRMGEWCVQNIPFEMAFWLLILDRETREYVTGYPLFDGPNERVFAFEEDNAEALAQLSPRVRELLRGESLQAPTHYPFLVRGGAEAFVEGEPDLAVIDGRVMVTRGVPIDRIFPGFTYWAFYGGDPS